MNTCDTCKWWELCFPKSTDHQCGHEKVGWLLNSAPDAATHDYEDVPIITGPKFGCIHHEPKP